MQARLILLSEPVWIKICREIDEISRKSIDCWGDWIRQHKKTLSRVCDEHTRN